jgi:aminocarboxymuconate-semialdehyde decarboxylase
MGTQAVRLEGARDEGSAMTKVRAIDTHAHVLTDETMGLLRKEAPKIGPILTPIDKDNYVLEVAGTPYKPFPSGGWNVEKRLADMDAAGVDMQLLSNTPQTFLYGQDAALTATTCVIQNDQIAKLVKQHPDRFMGIATLPMQAPDKAADELRRAMRKLALKGAQIGSNIMGKNLDDPSFEPLWAAAAELDAFIMVHPNNVAGADRLKSYYLTNLIGNPLDTTIAAASLVFGGVLERYPKLKFLMVHGGGFTPYQGARWIHGWKVRPEPKVNLPNGPAASLDKFFYDTILHSKTMLEHLIGAIGASRVLLGSDYPYDMAMLDCAAHVRSLDIPEADKATVLGGQAARLLGLDGAASKGAAAS